MKSLRPCRLCGSSADADWALIDPDESEEWQSYFIACSNDECDTMLSMEVHRLENNKHRKTIEQSLRVTWDHLNES